MATAELSTRMYINGQWVDASGGKTLAVINPADESTLAEVAFGGRADADRAIEAAAGAFPAWKATSAYDRAKILKKINEEATEVVMAATHQSPERLVSEIADLVFHLEVLMVNEGLDWVDVEEELRRRERS